MTNHAAFYKHASGRVMQVRTVAEAMYYQRRGYVIATWDEWYSYQLRLSEPPVDLDGDTQPIKAVRP